MWFVLGFVTLVGISVLMAWWRWGVNWSGTPHGAGRYKLATHKGKVQSLRVGFKGKTLAALEIVDAFGQRSMLQFKDVASNPRIADERFRFVVPKGADVIEQ